jgi:hypothetical protein
MIWLDDASQEGRSPRPRLLVIQNGARHNYAIPAAFNRAEALSGFYTDLTATQGVGALISCLVGRRGRIADALSRRTPPAEIAGKVHTSGSAYMAGAILKSAFRGRHAEEFATRLASSLAERSMITRGTCGATHIYTMFGEGGEFVRQAKEAGLGVVGDVYIALSADPIIAEETRRFPDWSDEPPRVSRIEEQAALNSTLLTQSDLLVCPSEFVRDDLVTHHGVEARRTVVIPYAVNSRWLSLETNPEMGRVLFAGSANVRKGIHHLAAAATLLKGTCKVRVAGGVSATVRQHRGAEALDFLGHLGPVEMAHEFARADVFALPSLAEGSAGVTAEALGAGIPVVTTKAAGSIVRDGIDGIIVPERDPEALADAIRSIVKDRDKRAAMSLAARERAQAFTWDGFVGNVIKATLRAQSW